MEKKTKKSGRPGYEPNAQHRKIVNAMTSCGIPVDDICKVIDNPATGKPIDKKTLYKYYRKEIESGHIVANAKVANNLFSIATGNTPQSVTAAIFWAKTRMKWNDKPQEGGGNIEEEMPSIIQIVGVKGRSDGKS